MVRITGGGYKVTSAQWGNTFRKPPRETHANATQLRASVPEQRLLKPLNAALLSRARAFRRPGMIGGPVDPKAHQADGRSLFGQIVHATPCLIRPPVHALGFLRKIVKHVRASTQPHSDLLCFLSPRSW